jgi:hypothetical protein
VGEAHGSPNFDARSITLGGKFFRRESLHGSTDETLAVRVSFWFTPKSAHNRTSVVEFLDKPTKLPRGLPWNNDQSQRGALMPHEELGRALDALALHAVLRKLSVETRCDHDCRPRWQS